MHIIWIPIISIILFFPMGALFSLAVGNDWGSGLAAFAMYVWFPYWLMKIWGKPNTDTMEEAMMQGELSSAEYDVHEAVFIHEYEDEGDHYLLAISEDKTLSLVGQYLHINAMEGRFPSTRIRLFWHRTKEYTFYVEPIGERLMPSQSLKLEEEEMFKLPDDREVIAQPLSDVLKCIKT